VRRNLLGSLALELGMGLELRRQAGEIPERLKIIERPALTILPRQVIREHIEGGLLRRPEHIRRQVEERTASRPAGVEGIVTDVRFWHGRILHLTLEGGQLEEEIDGYIEQAARNGSRRSDFDKYKKLRVPIATLKTDLPEIERDGIVCAAYEVIDTAQNNFDLTFGPADVYPSDCRIAA
jgi:hypothetical protein